MGQMHGWSVQNTAGLTECLIKQYTLRGKANLCKIIKSWYCSIFFQNCYHVSLRESEAICVCVHPYTINMTNQVQQNVVIKNYLKFECLPKFVLNYIVSVITNNFVIFL